MDKNIESGCLVVTLAFIITIGMILGFIGIAYWLWGAIAVSCLGLPALTYWQIAGLYWLIHILFPTSNSTYDTIKKAFDK